MFTVANRYLWLILLIGIALGVANYALGVWDALGRSILLQVIISMAIGYPSIVLAANDEQLLPTNFSKWQQILLKALAFFLIGCFATEVQLLADYLLFSAEGYALFSGGGIYVFNGILSTILGLMTHRWLRVNTIEPIVQNEDVTLDRIPLKQGEGTVLYPVTDILYFEAYDNYSFLHNLKGERTLCNYSLAYLEDKLSGQFLRVHRKYLINPVRVAKISPHIKGRFIIEFTGKGNSINSSAGYGEVVKGLLKL